MCIRDRATAMSLESYIPLIIKRKEAKQHGTKKMIEGIFTKGQNCLLVEDVITSGASLLETIPEIENEGITVSDIVVVLDRQQGGKEILEHKGFRVHTLFTISEAVSYTHLDVYKRQRAYHLLTGPSCSSFSVRSILGISLSSSAFFSKLPTGLKS